LLNHKQQAAQNNILCFGAKTQNQGYHMNSLSPHSLNSIRHTAFAVVAVTALTSHALARDVGAEGAKPQATPSQPTTPPAQTGGYPAVPLLSTGKTIVGETIRYPRTGEAHVTAAIFTLEPGGKSILHKHGVPLFAYILEGELTVDYGKQGTRTYKKGDSLMEAMNIAHFSVNNGGEPVRLLAVYMGATGAKDVVPVK
jgi:quercetin dioxygenase-like cupin family protein